MEYLEKDELNKLNNSSLTKDEKQLLHLLKLIKINKPQDYDRLIDSFLLYEIEYIERLLYKRESMDNNISENRDPLNITLTRKTEKFIDSIDKSLSQDLKIILLETC